MLKQFLAKHFGLVELNANEKIIIKDQTIKCFNECVRTGQPTDYLISRLTALGISFTYNKRTGLK
jgi:hypothetical protein